MRKRVNNTPSEIGGILLIDKPPGKTAFSLVASLRRHLKIKKIGHAGTLDPFATGVMVMLIGKAYTRLSDSFLGQDKVYTAEVRLGITTDTFDCDGKIQKESSLIPTQEEVVQQVEKFQGEIEQIPPMFSAKKVQGKKLYELARQGKSVERKPVTLKVQTEILQYEYPFLHLKISCSKGTYIRSLAHDLGELLGCGAHLTALRRLRSGPFQIHDCLDGKLLNSPECDAKMLIDAFRST